MGADLYEREPVVRAVLDRCDALLRDERDGSLLDVMFGRTGSAGDLDDPRWKQPAIYALECALTALWASVGIRPDVVFGHSLGEIAAAHTAGVFDLEDGLRFAAARGALIGALPGAGAMAAVFAPASRVSAALDEHNAASGVAGLCIAADNGAHQVVSGPAAEIDALLERLEAQRCPRRAAEEEPRLPQRDGGARPRGPGRGALEARLLAAVDHLREQPDGPGDGAGRGAGRGLLAAPGARARAVPRLRRDPGVHRSGHRRRDRAARGAGSDGVPRLADFGGRRGRCAGHAVEPAPALRLPARTVGRRRLRRSGRAGLRRGAPGRLRRAVRRGDAPPDLAARLSLPAPAPLDRGPEAAAPERRPPAAGGAARIASRRGRVRDGSVRLGPGVGERPPGVRPGGGAGRDVRHHGGDRAVGRGRPGGGPGGLPAPQPDDLPGGRLGRRVGRRGPEAADRVRRLGAAVVAPLRGVQPRERRRLDPAPGGPDVSGRARAGGRRSRTDGPRRHQGRHGAGRCRVALSQQGQHPGGARPRVSAAPGHLVPNRRSGRRGGAPGLPGRRRSGPASDPARRLLPDRAGRARSGPGRGQVDLHALRLGPAVAGRAAAGTDRLPRPHARRRRRERAEGRRGRLAGSRQGGSPHLLAGRGADRRGGRIHDEARDAGGHAVGVEGAPGSPVRGRVAGGGSRRRGSFRGFPRRCGHGRGPDGDLPGLPGRGGSDGRESGPPCSRTWTGCRGPMSSRRSTGWDGGAGRGRRSSRRRCAASWALRRITGACSPACSGSWSRREY